MKEKTLIFIPYQDTDNFYSEGIMTREYAMLYLLWEIGYKRIINIKKPRTFLDKKRYNIEEDYFLPGTKEAIIKKILNESDTYQYLPFLNISQMMEKRGWWIDGYPHILKNINISDDKDYLVYSNNPYAFKLIRSLSEKGCRIFFDIMDNFAIHPSLNEKEHEQALNGYKCIFNYADFISANSNQTCDYMKGYTKKPIHLVKNGVFENSEPKANVKIKEVSIIRNEKKHYRLCVGYVGKLGLRLDDNLIDSISKENPDVLFVFVGDYLKSQMNKKLIEIFDSRKNILHIPRVPSSYVYPILDEFDILSIPHSVGKKENGGDPLKLYQYLTRNKPIISTPILGMEEFKNYITVEKEEKKWIEYLKKSKQKTPNYHKNDIYWEYRMEPILNLIQKKKRSNIMNKQTNVKVLKIYLFVVLYSSVLKLVLGRWGTLISDVFTIFIGLSCIFNKNNAKTLINEKSMIIFFSIIIVQCIALLQLLNSNITNVLYALIEYRKSYFQVIALIVAYLLFQKTDKDVNGILKYIGAISVPIILYGIKQFFWWGELDNRLLGMNDAASATTTYSGHVRSMSFFSGPFHFGLFSVLIFSIFFYLTMKENKKYIIGIIISVLGVLCSITRTNIICLAVSIAIWTILFIKNDTRSKNKILRFFLVILGLSMMAIIIPLITSVEQKTNSIWANLLSSMNNIDEDTRFLGRIERWIRAKDAIMKNPIVGYGIGASGDTMEIYNISKFFITSHNMFLKIWLETGLFRINSIRYSVY